MAKIMMVMLECLKWGKLLEKERRMSEDTDIRASLEKGERSLSNPIIQAYPLVKESMWSLGSQRAGSRQDLRILRQPLRGRKRKPARGKLQLRLEDGNLRQGSHHQPNSLNGLLSGRQEPSRCCRFSENMRIFFCKSMKM